MAANTPVLFTLTVHDGTVSRTDTALVTILDSANSPPSVDAGAMTRTSPRTTPVSLNGTASDADTEDTLTYTWTFNNTESLGISLDDASALDTRFRAPNVSANTTVLFTLTVRDGTVSSTDTALVTIRDSANSPPSVDAGDDLDVTEDDRVFLNGTASDADTEDTLTYAWTFNNTELGITLDDASALDTRFRAPNVSANTTVLFTLTVRDGTVSSTDTALVTIRDSANSPPSVDAGDDLDVTEGDRVFLNGTASDEDPEDTLAYQWTHNATLTITIQDSTALNATFTAPTVSANTTVLFTLNVTDGTAHTTDTVIIVIGDDAPPTLSSAAYNTGTGILDITFSEPLGPTIAYSGIKLAGENGNVTLDAVTSKGHSTNTITATLSTAQRTTVGGAITLTVSTGAVSDIAGNDIVQATLAVDVTDGIPPTLSSAAYNTGTGILNITFSEPLGPTIAYSGIKLAGENGNVTLDAVTTKSHSTNTITATLSTAQRTTVGGAITLTVSTGAVSDIAGNDIVQATLAVDVTDGIPPTLSSAAYNTGTGILNITFSEPLSGTTIRYDRLHIRDTGQSSGGLSLDTVATRIVDPSSTTITLTLSAAQRQTVNDMVAPQLDIEAGAVSDTAGNGILAAPDQDIAIPPVLVSSSYNIDTGILSITFSKPLNHTATDYSGLAITGQMANVTLDQVATKTAGISTIWATLDAAQMATAGAAPTLVISEGAVSDIAGNGIARTTGTIVVTMLGPPIVEIRPVASIFDDESTTLSRAPNLDLFEIGGSTYAIVSSSRDNGIQIINLADPANPSPVASLTDTDPHRA